MRYPTQLKTKYKQEKEKLFKKLAKSNNGFYFNQKHTDLVDTIVKDIVSEIKKNIHRRRFYFNCGWGIWKTRFISKKRC